MVVGTPCGFLEMEVTMSSPAFTSVPPIGKLAGFISGPYEGCVVTVLSGICESPSGPCVAVCLEFGEEVTYCHPARLVSVTEWTRSRKRQLCHLRWMTHVITNEMCAVHIGGVWFTFIPHNFLCSQDIQFLVRRGVIKFAGQLDTLLRRHKLSYDEYVRQTHQKGGSVAPHDACVYKILRDPAQLIL